VKNRLGLGNPWFANAGLHNLWTNYGPFPGQFCADCDDSLDWLKRVLGVFFFYEEFRVFSLVDFFLDLSRVTTFHGNSHAHAAT